MSTSFVHEARVRKVGGGGDAIAVDLLAVEEPLAVCVAHPGDDGRRVERTLSITMRTPGHDADLAVGFAFTEGLIGSKDELADVRVDGDTAVVELRGAPRVDLARLDRHVVTSSACGACGKTSLDALRATPHVAIAPGPAIAPSVVHALPGALRRAQAVFERTGGLHAAALFDARGELRALREDVGRHNAVDKVLGASLRDGPWPLTSLILLVSGRASFELVQKARMAGVPILAAVGAPSSLAIEIARQEGMTVLGFVRDGRFNVYSGDERIARS